MPGWPLRSRSNPRRPQTPPKASTPQRTALPARTAQRSISASGDAPDRRDMPPNTPTKATWRRSLSGYQGRRKGEPQPRSSGEAAAGCSGNCWSGGSIAQIRWRRSCGFGASTHLRRVATRRRKSFFCSRSGPRAPAGWRPSRRDNQRRTRSSGPCRRSSPRCRVWATTDKSMRPMRLGARSGPPNPAGGIVGSASCTSPPSALTDEADLSTSSRWIRLRGLAHLREPCWLFRMLR